MARRWKRANRGPERPNLFSSQSSFTLIELLIVIAILVILAVVVILTLNPQELLAQARDSQRISDMSTLKSALSLFLVDTAGKGFMGTSSVVYVSIPDTASSTCGDLGLPTLPTSTGWTYHCSPTASSSLTDSTGWLPINFNSVSSGSPLPKLPTDPTNSSSTGLYYTYVTDSNGNFELTSLFESQKYSPQTFKDGGPNNFLYEAGNSLTLTPIILGRRFALQFNGLSGGSASYVSVPGSTDFELGSGDFTIEFWANFPSQVVGSAIVARDTAAVTPFLVGYQLNNGNISFYGTSNGTSWDIANAQSMGAASNAWAQYTVTRVGSTWTTYKNAVQVSQWTSTSTLASSANPLIMGQFNSIATTNAKVDELRIYKGRGKSLSEIQASYNSGAGTYGTTPDTGLVAGYHFGEGSGTSVSDYSGNSHAGTLTNFSGSYWTH